VVYLVLRILIYTPSAIIIMRSWYGRGRPLQVAVTSCCLVAFILFGYDQGVFSGIVGNEDWRKQFGYPNDSEEGIIVSCYNLGCLLGCLGECFSGILDCDGCRLTRSS
jgi:hypothetical protein